MLSCVPLMVRLKFHADKSIRIPSGNTQNILLTVLKEHEDLALVASESDICGMVSVWLT